MFSLIITIISIALVTALALATIYYGGAAFRQGGDAATAAKLINEGQQLSGAAAVFSAAEPVALAAIGDLTSTTNSAKAAYLASAPTGWTLDLATKSFQVTGQKDVVCGKVNDKAGSVPASVAAVTNYGCVVGATADTATMVFKY